VTGWRNQGGEKSKWMGCLSGGRRNRINQSNGEVRIRPFEGGVGGRRNTERGNDERKKTTDKGKIN